jgi:uncharacterized phage protein (TIGR01671 family)
LKQREILFRGKRIDNGEWVYGNLNYGTIGIKSIKDSYYISDFDVNPWDKKFYPVIHESVGQYTGLTDKNGKKIFEGDIVEYPFEYGGYKGENIYEVVFENRHGTAYFGIKMSNIETWGFDMEVPARLMKVIGNTHENPELLEGKS